MAHPLLSLAGHQVVAYHCTNMEWNTAIILPAMHNQYLHGYQWCQGPGWIPRISLVCHMLPSMPLKGAHPSEEDICGSVCSSVGPSLEDYHVIFHVNNNTVFNAI